jgi:transcription-repair coupling factor (superfamily II helicase)
MFPTKEILEDLKHKGHSAVSGLSPSAAASLAASLPDPGRLVVVTPGWDSALSFRSDLSFFLPDQDVGILPEAESFPFDRLLPDIEIAALRVRALRSMRQGSGPTIIPAVALAQSTPPPDVISGTSFRIRTGETLDRENLLITLDSMGYHRVAVVSQVGEMAVRGGILDLYSPQSAHPVRVELWEEDVQSIRSFDPDSQRSVGSSDEASVLPVSEVVGGPGIYSAGKERLAEFLVNAGLPARDVEQTLSLWENPSDFPGMAHFLPIVYGTLALPTDHFPDDAVVLLLEPEEIREALKTFDLDSRARRYHGSPTPEQAYGNPEEIWTELNRNEVVNAQTVHRMDSRAIRCTAPFSALLPKSRPDRFAELGRLLREAGNEKVLIAAHSSSAADRIASVLTDLGLTVVHRDRWEGSDTWEGLNIVTGSLSSGFSLPDTRVTYLSDADLFGPVKTGKPARPSGAEWDLPIGSLTNGDIVVHIEHGIGRYEGLRQMEVADLRGDFLQLTYRGGDSLYVPVEDMNQVQRYRSSATTPPALSKLGGLTWRRAKDRVNRSLKMMAEELLKMTAKRKTAEGFSFPEPDTLFREFEATFPWSETPDQERSIGEVLSDMASPQPMDRLVCGDVGYGKTEVAIRAAFLAVLGGKQAGILVPTTVLAQQHFQNFTARLADFPVRTGMLSRFVSAGDQAKVLKDLRDGKIDIVIGTHRLLSEDVQFKDLGLLVIDEEHRFGVRHKEKLKKIKEVVDILTLSATPIPRTLFQAFSGLRNLSLIHTPPADRKSIHTEIRYFEEELIGEAVNREIDRGGQVYIVHNRVMSIEAFTRMVQELVPHARIGMAHGQMGEKKLEQVMVGFLKREYDVLITTAIIESGLDITNANTLIVNRADRFGLAQLYQLRGRVGRSSTLAYAYFLVPSEASLSSKARKRLASLKDLTELGSGFKLASYDLEIRGAGNLLGEEQSGHIGAVGLDLYSQLLERAAVDAAGRAETLEVEPSVKLEIPALLTEDYLPDVGERLTLYKRLASARTMEELEALRTEMADRFGRFPQEVLGLFTRMEVIILARKLAVERIDMAGPYYIITLHPQARISPDALVQLLTRDNRARFIPPTTLRLDVSGMETTQDRITYLMDILRTL